MISPSRNLPRARRHGWHMEDRMSLIPHWPSNILNWRLVRISTLFFPRLKRGSVGHFRKWSKRNFTGKFLFTFKAEAATGDQGVFPVHQLHGDVPLFVNRKLTGILLIGWQTVLRESLKCIFCKVWNLPLRKFGVWLHWGPSSSNLLRIGQETVTSFGSSTLTKFIWGNSDAAGILSSVTKGWAKSIVGLAVSKALDTLPRHL